MTLCRTGSQFHWCMTRSIPETGLSALICGICVSNLQTQISQIRADSDVEEPGVSSRLRPALGALHHTVPVVPAELAVISGDQRSEMPLPAEAASWWIAVITALSRCTAPGSYGSFAPHQTCRMPQNHVTVHRRRGRRRPAALQPGGEQFVVRRSMIPDGDRRHHPESRRVVNQPQPARRVAVSHGSATHRMLGSSGLILGRAAIGTGDARSAIICGICVSNLKTQISQMSAEPDIDGPSISHDGSSPTRRSRTGHRRSPLRVEYVPGPRLSCRLQLRREP